MELYRTDKTVVILGPPEEKRQMMNTINYNVVEMSVSDVPDAVTRALLGHGHFPGDIARRTVVSPPRVMWPHTPETCQTDDHAGVWLDQTVMVCTGCGLDCT